MTERKIKPIEIIFEPETSQNLQTKFANVSQSKLCSKTLPFFTVGDNFKYMYLCSVCWYYVSEWRLRNAYRI